MKSILLTCDTEIGELSKNLNNAFEIFIEGKINGNTVGVKLINNIAREYGAVVNHFVDIYPPKYEIELANLCDGILSEGHFVGLHTHPSTRFGKRYMHEYDSNMQDRIIEFGKKFFYNHVGLDVQAHRAGGYGANDDTYVALKKHSIGKDSSFFYGANECKINYQYMNLPTIINGVMEIPITVYQENRKLFGKILKSKSTIKKLDFRYGSDSKSIISVIKQAPDNAIIVLFLHSFNFINIPYNVRSGKFGSVHVNKDLILEYHKLLSGIVKCGDCRFCTFDSLSFDDNKLCDYKINLDKNIDFKKSIYNKISEKALGRINV